VEKPHRKHSIEPIVGKGQSCGVAAQVVEVVGDTRRHRPLVALLEHRLGDVQPDDLRTSLGEHRREPSGPAGNLQNLSVLDRAECLQDGTLLALVDEFPATRESLLVV
jgi:hypothetical protein